MRPADRQPRPFPLAPGRPSSDDCRPLSAREVIICLVVVLVLAAAGGTLDHWGEGSAQSVSTSEEGQP